MDARRALAMVAGLLLASAVAVPASVGDWASDGVRVPGTRNRVSAIAPDGAGGAFVAWGYLIDDSGLLPPPSPWDVRVHHLRADGSPDPTFPDSGRTVWTNGDLEVLSTRLLPDGSGGSYLLATACGPQIVPHTTCHENGIVRLFHLGADGIAVFGWPIGGLDIPSSQLAYNADHVDIGVEPDGHVVVAWSQPVNGREIVLAQRYAGNGGSTWTADAPYAGRIVFLTSNEYLTPRVAIDRATSAIVAATRGVGFEPNETYDVVANALRLSDGARQWSSAGRLLIQSGANTTLSAAAADRAGGVAAAALSLGTVRVQATNASGIPLWGSAGVSVGTTTYGRVGLVALEPANLAVQWIDETSQKRLQRVGLGGSIRWPQWPDGRPVGGAADGFTANQLRLRPDGGTWSLWGSGANDGDLHALPIDSTSVPIGGVGEGGHVLCGAPGTRSVTGAALEGSHLFATWADLRADPGSAYAQRLTLPAADAPGAGSAALFAFEGMRPNPSRGPWSLALRLPATADVRVEVFDLAGRRRVDRVLTALGAGLRVVSLGEAASLAPGVYRVRCTAGGVSVTRTAVRLR